MTTISKKNNFTNQLAELNNLNFKEWFFYPGMLFQSKNKWWNSTSKSLRNTPHEGIDLLFYKNNNNEILKIDTNTKIPIIYNGTVIKINDDYLGKSIYIKHNIYNKNKWQLYSILGHTRPYLNIVTGKEIDKNEVIATLSNSKKNAIIPSHLHLSFLWISNKISYSKLEWDYLNKNEYAIFIDPIKILGIPI